MSGDLLRRAAALLRTTASEVPSDVPWTVEIDEQDDVADDVYLVADYPDVPTTTYLGDMLNPQVATYCGTFHPPVALALAEALDNAATDAEYAEAFPQSEMAVEDGSNLIAVAREVLREPEVTP